MLWCKHGYKYKNEVIMKKLTKEEIRTVTLLFLRKKIIIFDEKRKTIEEPFFICLNGDNFQLSIRPRLRQKLINK